MEFSENNKIQKLWISIIHEYNLYIQIDVTNYITYLVQMSTYSYTLSDARSGASSTGIICGIDSPSNVGPAVLHKELEKIREKRYQKMMKQYPFDEEDSEKVREYVPLIYKRYAKNREQLVRQMCSIYEINCIYSVSNIVVLETLETFETCQGCIHQWPGQIDHMECPSGCLHDRSSCDICKM